MHLGITGLNKVQLTVCRLPLASHYDRILQLSIATSSVHLFTVPLPNLLKGIIHGSLNLKILVVTKVKKVPGGII